MPRATTKKKVRAHASAASQGTAAARRESSAPVRRVRVDKLSVSLASDDVAWVTSRAKRLGTSVSAVIANAVADQRRAEARHRVLDMLGGDEIDEASIAAARREAWGP